MAGIIQNQDIKSVTELTGAGATAADLPNDDKVYVSANSINKTLKQAIIDGDIGVGGSSKNYFPNTASGGQSTSGFNAFADAAASLPVDGTGGSPSGNLLLASSASSPLSGAYSFTITKSNSVSTQGEGYSRDFTIDPSDKGKVLAFTMNYGVVSGTYADNDLIIYFYDVTNGALLEPAPYKIKNHGLVSDRFFCELQVPYNCTTLRWIIYQSSATTQNYQIKIDDLLFGPQAKLYGSAVTDWIDFTPTGSWVTNTTYTGKYRRIGDSAQIQYRILLSGAPTATTLTLSPPTGLIFDTSKAVSGNPIVGVGHILDSGTDEHAFVALWGSSTSITARSWISASAGSPDSIGNNLTNVSPITFANGDALNVTVTIPIVGWSSSQLLSNEASTRVIAFKGYMSTNHSGTPNSTLPINTVVFDTHGAFNTSTYEYTVKVPGKYVAVAGIGLGNLEVGSFQVYKNGAALADGPSTGYIVAVYGVSGSTNFNSGSVEFDAIAGDVIKLVNNTNGTTVQAANTYFSLSLKSGPAQILASETVSFSANTSTTAGTTATPFIYTVKDHDTHGAYSTSTGIFTAPISGKYSFQWNNYTGATAAQAKLHKNGAAIINGSSSVANTSVGSGSHTLSLIAGDTIEIRPETNATASGGATTNTFSGFRVGN